MDCNKYSSALLKKDYITTRCNRAKLDTGTFCNYDCEFCYYQGLLHIKTNYDLIYSRFTFHSITNDEQVIFLKTIPKNAYLAIEARSIKDIDNNIYFGREHYRNYIDIEHLKKKLYENNFQILYIEEGPNMAKYKNENNICIRTVCKKR